MNQFLDVFSVLKIHMAKISLKNDFLFFLICCRSPPTWISLLGPFSGSFNMDNDSGMWLYLLLY